MLRLAAQFRNEDHFAHFDFFVPQVFLVEVIISIALLFGIWSTFGSLPERAMAINLSQGLYRSPGQVAVAVCVPHRRRGPVLRGPAWTQARPGRVPGQAGQRSNQPATSSATMVALRPQNPL